MKKSAYNPGEMSSSAGQAHGSVGDDGIKFNFSGRSVWEKFFAAGMLKGSEVASQKNSMSILETPF